jgi:hypothetical protein
MILLIPIIAILCAWIWIDVWRMPEKYLWLNRKPFNCPMCLSMWLSLIIYLCPTFIQETLFVTSTAAALGAWADQKR